MTSRRVVVVRDVGALVADQVGAIVEWLDDPVETSALVLVGGGGRMSPKLSKAVKAAGGATHQPEAEVRGRRGDPGPVAKQLARSAGLAGIELADEAVDHVVSHFGEDAGRVPELVSVLHATFGDAARLSADHVDPYLGEVGTAARYELANAIDAGDVASALAVLDRLLHATSAKQPKPLHPLQILASLQFHYRDLLRLDDPEIVTKEQAGEVLGMKSVWAAKHRLEASHRLGADGLRRAYALLATADVDVRGASGVPAETVLEVLVARLAALAGRHARGRASTR